MRSKLAADASCFASNNATLHPAESGAPLLASQVEPAEAGLLAAPAVNILPANIDLTSKVSCSRACRRPPACFLHKHCSAP